MNIKEYKKQLKEQALFPIKNNFDKLDYQDYLPVRKTQFWFRFKYLGYSFSLIVLFVISFFIYTNLTPYTSLSIQINPEINLTFNRYLRVIKVEGADESSQELINDINIKNKSIDDALESIYDQSKEFDYTFENNLYVLFGIYDSKNVDEITKRIESSFSEDIKAIIITDEIISTTDVSRMEESAILTPEFSLESEGSVEDSFFAEIISLEEALSQYGVSQTKYTLVYNIFQTNTQYNTPADFINLLEMEIYELYLIYNNQN